MDSEGKFWAWFLLVAAVVIISLTGVIGYSVNASQDRELKFKLSCVNSGKSIDYTENGKPRCLNEDKNE